MIKRPTDPRRLDVASFALASAELEGELRLSELPRLAESTHRGAKLDVEPVVRWRVRGERREVQRGPAQIWLHLNAVVSLSLTCQRCLDAILVPVQAQRSFMFVQGENLAAELDASLEDDVLALTRELDVQDLLEDELLLALPLVPKHDQCPELFPLGSQTEDPSSQTPKPFASLAALKSTRRG